MKFEPSELFAIIGDKFVPTYQKPPYLDGHTFCIENRVLDSLLSETQYCKAFNIVKENGENDWFWGYAYNLLFQAIDFDWDNDVWLCKVLGYLE